VDQRQPVALDAARDAGGAVDQVRYEDIFERPVMFRTVFDCSIPFDAR
jgi:hypothetical protein